MAKSKKKTLSRSAIDKRVKAIRRVMELTSKQMVDMKNTVGTLNVYPTSNGIVRALTYGFETPEVRPLLVNMHGSGFVMGSAAMDDPFMQQFVDECGVKVLNIDYPLSPDVMFPVALGQCYALIRYAKEHADELGIDGERIMLMGHSAGGNFCAAIGLLENDCPTLGLRGIILDYPPTDLSIDAYDKPLPKGCLPPRMCRIFDAAYCTEEERTNPLVSPALSTPDLVGNFPPTLVITASQDSLAQETERFKDTLVAAGVHVVFKQFEGAPHGFTIMTKKKGKRNKEVCRMSLEAWQMMKDFVTSRMDS